MISKHITKNERELQLQRKAGARRIAELTRSLKRVKMFGELGINSINHDVAMAKEYQQEELEAKFTEDEEAISYKNNLKPFLSLGFTEKSLNFGGNIAYIIIGQSLVLRIPQRYKKYLAPISFFLERIFSKLPFMPKLFFSAVWKKNNL